MTVTRPVFKSSVGVDLTGVIPDTPSPRGRRTATVPYLPRPTSHACAYADDVVKDLPPVMDTAQVAEALCATGRDAITALITSGQLRAMRGPGRGYRVTRAALRDYLISAHQ